MYWTFSRELTFATATKSNVSGFKTFDNLQKNREIAKISYFKVLHYVREMIWRFKTVYNYSTTRFFYKKNFYKKMSLKTPPNLQKMLRKSPAPNAWAAVFKHWERDKS